MINQRYSKVTFKLKMNLIGTSNYYDYIIMNNNSNIKFRVYSYRFSILTKGKLSIKLNIFEDENLDV